MANFILKLVCIIATIITLIVEIIIKIGASIMLIGYTIIVLFISIICGELVSDDVNWDPMLRWRINDSRAYPITHRTSDILSEFVIQFEKNQK